MLKVPQLDDLDYETIFTRARSRIAQYTEEWTDLNHHDPGITLLQGMAWLVDTLNYYTDATGEEHRLRYLKLLGIRPRAAAASCVLALHTGQRHISLPPGTRVQAEGIPFELPQGYEADSNRLEALYSEVDGTIADRTPFAGVDGGYAQIFTYDPDKRAAALLGFSHALQGEAALYVEVSEAHLRNHFSPQTAPGLASLAWEYHDGNGWQPARLLSDETGGLLRGGFIRLGIPGKTRRYSGSGLKPAHYLRARLECNHYDVLPEIGRIELNCVRAEQIRTAAKTLELAYAGRQELPIPYCVRETDRIMVAVEQEDGFQVWYRFAEEAGALCTVEPGGRPWERVIRFRGESAPQKGQRILVTILDSSLYDQLLLGRTNGCAGLRLPVELEDAWSMRLALFDQTDTGEMPRFQLWEPCGDITQAGPGDRVFAYDRAAGAVVFGDALAGLQPKAGKLVMALEATTSLLGGGNARRGRVNAFADDAGAGITVENITDATGGESPKDSHELEKQIGGKLEAASRAVNTADYIRLVKSTPGLIIDLVQVISRGEYDRFAGTTSSPNTVYIAVKPYSPRQPRPVLSEVYRAAIRKHLERYRLLTTSLKVIPARYAAITVNGRIVLRENAGGARQQVEELLRGLIDFRHTGRFGAHIVYGFLFSRLEMLEGVASVAELGLGYSGGRCVKNDQGDLLVHGDTLAWLAEINIEYN